ncbi:glycoside hydrolase family 18 protein, partial [Cercospora zeae-maydis SCOH1-5]
SSNNVAAYWGQNSFGQANGPQAQQSLATYCADTDVDIIPLAFTAVTSTDGTNAAGEQRMVVNFANAGDNCSIFSGTGLLDCGETIGKDITTCQEQYNKTILLSIGGATYTEGGFPSEDAAISAAEMVWKTFGPAADAAQVLRPFGNAVIDGFDIDIESTTQNFLPFVRRLRELMDANAAKQYYLTAAPQCPYPDAAVSDLLDSDVRFDAVFVQFYNNYCGVQSYSNTSDAQASFNFESWDTWAKNATSRQSSATPANVKVFLGVPGGVTGAGSGYATLEQLSPVIEYSQKFESFGGVMVWDITQAKANEKWLPGVKQVLLNNAEG